MPAWMILQSSENVWSVMACALRISSISHGSFVARKASIFACIGTSTACSASL